MREDTVYVCLLCFGHVVWVGNLLVRFAFRTRCDHVRVRVRVIFPTLAKHVSIFFDRKSDDIHLS